MINFPSVQIPVSVRKPYTSDKTALSKKNIKTARKNKLKVETLKSI